MKRFFILFAGLFLIIRVDSWAAYTHVSADTLQQWIAIGTDFDFLLIDVRETSEATAVIATDSCKPYLLPLSTGVFVQTMSKLPKDTAIVLYCASGHRSDQASDTLDAHGFKSVYSLTGGFSGWGSRPSKPGSFIKPADQLPEPSMHKKSTGIFYTKTPSSLKHKLLFSGNIARIAWPISTSHAFFLFDLQGKCVLSKQNPFLHSTTLPLIGLKHGLYVAKLESRNSGNIEAVTKIR